jgi:hypothetical protein
MEKKGKVIKLFKQDERNETEEHTYEEVEILTINKGVFGELEIRIDEYIGIHPSEEFEKTLLEELKYSLGGERSEEFDPTIQIAIDKIESCVSYTDEEEDE